MRRQNARVVERLIVIVGLAAALGIDWPGAVAVGSNVALGPLPTVPPLAPVTTEPTMLAKFVRSLASGVPPRRSATLTLSAVEA